MQYHVMGSKNIENLSSNGRHEECIQACKELLRSEPEAPFAWKYTGISFLYLGQPEKAKQWLYKAHQLDKRDPEIAKCIGNAFLSLSQTEEATKWYKISLEINKHYAPTINNLARIKSQGGKHKEAIDLYQRALQADPHLYQAYIGAAGSFLATGDLDRAETFATQAIEVNAKLPGANKILGCIFQNKQRIEKAIKCYRKELAINPRCRTSLINIGSLFLQKRNTEEAIKVLELASMISTSEQCSLLMAQSYQSAGRLEEAIEEYKKIDLSKSKDKLIPFNLGICLLSTGNNADAIAAFEIAIKIDATFLPAWGNIGIALQKEGRIKEALSATKKFIEHEPNHPSALMNLGILYKDLGELDKALSATLQSLELEPNNANTLMNLGSIHKSLGNLDEALISTIHSLKIKPDNPDALINLGTIYKDLGNLDKALDCNLKSIELKANNPNALMNVGWIYCERGESERALDFTHKALEQRSDNPGALLNLANIYENMGNFEKAITASLKALKLDPKGSAALCKLGLIYMAFGKTIEAKKYLKDAISINAQEVEAYQALSHMLESNEEAEKLQHSIRKAKTEKLTPQQKSFVEFALSNCYHKLQEYDIAAEHLKAANHNKLIAFPSNANMLQKQISVNLSNQNTYLNTPINEDSGKGRIFLVGLPRCGSTLLETVLSMSPVVKDLGECGALTDAISRLYEQKGEATMHQNLSEIYSKMIPISNDNFKYTIDKQLYNFLHTNLIAYHMPAAKIIHCRRNPMDHILSMHRNNLMSGNNYSANLEDAARVLIAQDQAMQRQKEAHPQKILTFDYDKFVNNPEEGTDKILSWLGMDFDKSFLHPEKSTRNINTASAIQARRPIHNKSVGGWKNYEKLLRPALNIFHENNIRVG